MDGRGRQRFLRPISRRFDSIRSNGIRRSAEAILRTGSNASTMNADASDPFYDDDNLAPVMPAIDAVQQLLEEENRSRLVKERQEQRKKSGKINNEVELDEQAEKVANLVQHSPPMPSSSNDDRSSKLRHDDPINRRAKNSEGRSMSAVPSDRSQTRTSTLDTPEDDESLIVRNNPLHNFAIPNNQKGHDEYEFIPKSVILDVYSNDPEVKRFLKQLPKIGNEFGYNEQDYKCYSCRRPIGMVFGESVLCNFDGHHYCSDCHLGEKSSIPARILCNWDFNKYPISKRNQHFLTLISNEPIFEIKTMAPLLYKTCSEFKEIEELRCQAFFIRSYCFTCVQDSISFELTKLVWPREHLIKQVDQYSLEDLIQIKNGALKQVLKNVITFGRQHVLSCMLCCQKGFICELCKSSQIIYPFDTESVYRCNSCQSIYHKTCFKSRPNCDACPRCQRLKARRNEL